MNSNDLERIISKLLLEYPFVTEEHKRIVREEYLNSNKPAHIIEKELLSKIKNHVIDRNKPEFIPITDFVSYHINNRSIHMHLIPNSLVPYMKKIIKQYGVEESRHKFEDFLSLKLNEAMQIIAKMMSEDEGIIKVSATSELVKKYQSIFEKEGFLINLFTDQQLATIFPGKSIEEREKFRYNAYMNREKVISKYNSQGLTTNKIN